MFAPYLYLTVTIEERDGWHEAGEVHLHPGGQGFWIARMLAELGGNPVLCGPVGGEVGAVLTAIVPACRLNERFSSHALPEPRILPARAWPVPP